MPLLRPTSEGIPITTRSGCQLSKWRTAEKCHGLLSVLGTPRNPSTPFSILDLKAQAVRLPISKGAQILLSELLTWSGERGYCWWGKPAIAKDLNWSVSEVWRRATELKRAGLLEVVPRPGRSNYWVPLPGRNRMERVQNELAPLADSRGPFLKEKRKELKRCVVPNQSTCYQRAFSLPPTRKRQRS